MVVVDFWGDWRVVNVIGGGSSSPGRKSTHWVSATATVTKSDVASNLCWKKVIIAED